VRDKRNEVFSGHQFKLIYAVLMAMTTKIDVLWYVTPCGISANEVPDYYEPFFSLVIMETAEYRIIWNAGTLVPDYLAFLPG
jgi:hypothetical protein